ncbi:hypothetical protein D3C81_2070930 [compost metagenome]
MNYAAEKLLFIQGMVATEQDIRALQSLMSNAVEYITHLNLALLMTDQELDTDQFRVKLLLDQVGQFVLDVSDLKVSLKTA